MIIRKLLIVFICIIGKNASLQISKQSYLVSQNQLGNTITIYITISTFTSVRPYNARCPVPSYLTIPAVTSQNVTNKSCLVCVKIEKYVF